MTQQSVLFAALKTKVREEQAPECSKVSVCLQRFNNKLKPTKNQHKRLCVFVGGRCRGNRRQSEARRQRASQLIYCCSSLQV